MENDAIASRCDKVPGAMLSPDGAISSETMAPGADPDVPGDPDVLNEILSSPQLERERNK